MKIFFYILKSIFYNSLISTLVIVGLVWVSQSFRSIKFILNKGGSFIDFFKLSIFSMPAWLEISISFGIFFGILITYSKLESEHELIALKTSGFTSYQLSFPAIFFGFILSIILFLNLHILLPYSYTFYKNYENNIRLKSPQAIVSQGNFYNDKDKKTFFAKSINGNEIRNLFIQDKSKDNQVVEIFSNKGKLFVQNKQIKLMLYNGTKIITDNNNAPLFIDFKQDVISLKKQKKITKKEITTKRVIELKELTFLELIEKSKEFPDLKGKYISEAHSRNVNSLSPLIFTFIVLSLILKQNISRNKGLSKKFIVFSFIFITQIILVLLKNLVSNDPSFLYAYYIIPCLIILISFFAIKYEKYFYNLNFKDG